MVSSRHTRYRAELQRLGHQGRRIDSEIEGTYPGAEQSLAPGSYVRVPDHARLRPGVGLALEAWVRPALPAVRSQGLLSKWDADRQAGYAMVLDEGGALALWLGDGERRLTLTTGTPLAPRAWHRVRASWDAASGACEVHQAPSEARVRGELPFEVSDPGLPLLLAAYWERAGLAAGHFNGKLESPRVDRLGTCEAAWDFSTDPGTARIREPVHGLEGTAVNLPTRAITGHAYTGREVDFRQAPDEYGAIAFHDDDLEDAEWEPAFTLSVPGDLPSGAYAVRLTAAGAEDQVPFFVRPGRGAVSAPIAVLLPTYSYLAYANEHISWRNPGAPAPHDVEGELSDADRYAAARRLLSLYDHHADGSGACYASRLRPLVNMRPGYANPLIRGPHQLSADLLLLEWLGRHGYRFDVLTDEDLQRKGEALLAPYAVVVTGSHPEYCTADMLDAIEGYRTDGGRLMYLGGNGFYWVVGVDADRPHLMEVRRGHSGTGTWRSEPGEVHLSLSGEPGGLWRHRGRAPQRLVDVGMTAAGYDRSLPYRRTPASTDPRASFIFDGLEYDEPIGTRGSVMGGAGGLELDRYDPALGSTPDALVVATARGFSDSYQHAVEEVLTTDSRQGGPHCDLVRADMTYSDGTNGAAVFAVGSIAWCGALLEDRAVSRITANVLDRFVADHDDD